MTFQREQFTQSERHLNVFTAEASDLGLKPGQWPREIWIEADNGAFHYKLIRLDADNGVYASTHPAELAGRLVIFND